MQLSSLSNFGTFSSPPQETLCHSAAIHSSHPPQPEETTNLLSISLDLLILDISHWWDHTVCHLFMTDLHFACFQDSSLLEHVSGLLFLLLLNNFHCLHRMRSVYAGIVWQTVGLLHPFGYERSRTSVCTDVSFSLLLGLYLGVLIARSYGSSTVTFLRNWKTFYQVAALS